LADIVERAQEDRKSLTKKDAKILLDNLEAHRAMKSTGYRVASKAQQQDVARMAKKFQDEVRDFA
jgi:hypothetical protein